jgi:hypothetical protein
VEIFDAGNHSLIRIATSAPLDRESSEFAAPINRELVRYPRSMARTFLIYRRCRKRIHNEVENTIGLVRVRVSHPTCLQNSGTEFSWVRQSPPDPLRQCTLWTLPGDRSDRPLATTIATFTASNAATT